MRTYKVKSFVTIRDGILGLTLEQANARRYTLKEIKPATAEKRGVYEVLLPGAGFKAGEVIEGDVTISKANAVCFEDITNPEEPKQADPAVAKKTTSTKKAKK